MDFALRWSVVDLFTSFVGVISCMSRKVVVWEVMVKECELADEVIFDIHRG